MRDAASHNRASQYGRSQTTTLQDFAIQFNAQLAGGLPVSAVALRRIQQQNSLEDLRAIQGVANPLQ